MSENEKKKGNVLSRARGWIGDRGSSVSKWTRARALNLSEMLDSDVGSIAQGAVELADKSGVAKFVAGALKSYGEGLYKEDVKFFEDKFNLTKKQDRSEISMSLTVFEDGDRISQYHMIDGVRNSKNLHVEGIDADPRFKGLSKEYRTPDKHKDFSVDFDALGGTSTTNQVNMAGGFKYFTLAWNGANKLLREGRYDHDDIHLEFEGPPYVYDKGSPDTREFTKYHFTGDHLKQLIEEVSLQYDSSENNNNIISYRDAEFEDILAGTLTYIEQSYQGSTQCPDARIEAQRETHTEYIDECVRRIGTIPRLPQLEDLDYSNKAHEKLVRRKQAEEDRALRNEKRYHELNRSKLPNYPESNNGVKEKPKTKLQLLAEVDDSWDFEL